MADSLTLTARVRALMCCGAAVLWMSPVVGSAQDVTAMSVDLGRQAVLTYHPHIDLATLAPAEVEVFQEGEMFHGVVRMSWTDDQVGLRGYLQLPPVPHTAEIKGSFLIQPRRQVLHTLTYVDDTIEVSPHIDHTSKIIADFNVDLARGGHQRIGVPYASTVYAAGTAAVLPRTGRGWWTGWNLMAGLRNAFSNGTGCSTGAGSGSDCELGTACGDAAAQAINGVDGSRGTADGLRSGQSTPTDATIEPAPAAEDPFGASPSPDADESASRLILLLGDEGVRPPARQTNLP